ncbi:MAG: bL28 family ribosomal protein [Armatimonadota bacterium]
MPRVCAISGKKSQTGRNVRYNHGGMWELRAQKKPRRFQVNLQTVTVPVAGGGTKKIKVAARMLTSRKFKAILAGHIPLPPGV